MKRDLAPTRLDHMIDIVQQHVLDGQRVATAIPFLSLLRSSHPTPVSKGVLKPSCCVILQGQKRVHLADDILDYGPGEYLVVSVDMPASGHIVSATPDKPYLLLNIELDPAEIAAIVLEAKIAIDSQQPVRGAFVGRTDDHLQESLYQLTRLLQAPPAEAAFPTAAYQVGYESASQFSREYRRLFGAPPCRTSGNSGPHHENE